MPVCVEDKGYLEIGADFFIFGIPNLIKPETQLSCSGIIISLLFCCFNPSYAVLSTLPRGAYTHFILVIKILAVL